MEKKLYDGFRCMNKKIDSKDVMMMSPLQLAYIGDAVYELFVRTYLMERDISVNDLHKEAIQYVKAKGQSDIVHFLQDELTEEENNIVKRGRNAKSSSVPKNANLIDYKYATGFESLIGFLYLTGRDERILEIFEKITQIS